MHGPAEDIGDYLIGPLPPSDLTSIRPLTEIYHNPIPLNARSTFNWTTIKTEVSRLVKPFDDIMQDLFEGSVLDGTLSLAGHSPMSYDGSWRRMWLQAKRTVPGSWLQGLDFFIKVGLLPYSDVRVIVLRKSDRHDRNRQVAVQDPRVRT